MAFSMEEKGSPYDFDYKIYFSEFMKVIAHIYLMVSSLSSSIYILESGDQYISPFHDIPLFVAGGERIVCNMIVEIPRWTNAKMEV